MTQRKGKTMLRRLAAALALAAGLTGASVLSAQTAQAADCKQIMGNPESKEGVAVCNDNSVEIGGKIKDVSTHTPLGGQNGFFQKAGTDAQGAAQRAGKFFSKTFKWGTSNDMVREPGDA